MQCSTVQVAHGAGGVIVCRFWISATRCLCSAGGARCRWHYSVPLLTQCKLVSVQHHFLMQQHRTVFQMVLQNGAIPNDAMCALCYGSMPFLDKCYMLLAVKTMHSADSDMQNDVVRAKRYIAKRWCENRTISTVIIGNCIILEIISSDYFSIFLWFYLK